MKASDGLSYATDNTYYGLTTNKASTVYITGVRWACPLYSTVLECNQVLVGITCCVFWDKYASDISCLRSV